VKSIGSNKRIAAVTTAMSVFLGLQSLPAFAETATPKSAAAKEPSKESLYRLGDNIAPVRYELEFSPDAEKAKFTGAERIEIKIKKASSSIVMNANDLQVSSAKLVSSSNKSIPLQIKLDKTLERVTFLTPSAQAPGTYHLECEFAGSLNDKLAGFYRSTIKDKEGKTHYLAVTQMEPTDARRMFPCFDEPDFKAAFKVKAHIPANNAAISNAPVLKEETEKNGGKKLVEFEETKPMSSYLLALLIGEFKPTEVLESEGVAIRVWSVEHDPTLGNYARDNAGKILKYLNSYFQIPYPWKKLDLIAIPDFEAGAMENPGAITFREKYLLADEKSSALNTKQDIVAITAHEMAHLWFGDLVTMKWWDDIWLNEAFATWMAKRAVDHVHPEWNAMAEFFSDRLKALYTDSLYSTRSIQSQVIKPEDAMQMFDEITYVKGASVLRMLEHFIGEKHFQEGVTAYLREHSFNNATTNDLWRALGKASGKPVKDIMDTWCKQPGYPLINVLSAGSGELKVTQERFLLDNNKNAAGSKQASAQLWQVPLGLRDPNSAFEKDENNRPLVKPEYTLVKGKSQTIKSAAAKSKALVANAGGYGFYRTEYTVEMSKILASKLSSMVPAGRLCFLSDHAALATAGKIPVGQYLDVLKMYSSETDLSVWNCIIDSLTKLDRFVDSAERADYAKFVRHMLKDEYERLGWEAKADEEAPVRLLRAQIIDTLGTLGADQDVIAKARKIFADYVSDPQSASPDVLDAVTDVVAYNGGKADFETIKTLWHKATTPEVEHRNLFALGGFRDTTVVAEALPITLSKDVRSQDAPKLLSHFYDVTDAKSAAWKFMKAHWPEIRKQYAEHMLARLSEGPQSLISEAEYNDVKAFFAANKVPEGSSNVARMLEKLRINVQVKQHSGKVINAWLKDYAASLK